MATIQANKGWQKTSFYIYKDKAYQLRAYGKWSWGEDLVGPTGYSRNDGPKKDGTLFKDLFSSNIGQLIGRVGETGPVFQIGESAKIQNVEKADYLWARMNSETPDAQRATTHKGEVTLEFAEIPK